MEKTAASAKARDGSGRTRRARRAIYHEEDGEEGELRKELLSVTL